MDPIAHTLVGVVLAETSLKRRSPLALPTLVLGANAPDIDAASMLIGADFSLGFRRGWTHGVLAMLVLPLALAGLVYLFGRMRTSNGVDAARGHVRAGPLIGLSYLAVLTHPALDWLNTYGIRLLMPFDDRWFYGDALFIVDPWVWLAAGLVAVLGGAQTRARTMLWLGLGVVLTGLISAFPGVPPFARLVWLAAIAAIVLLKVQRATPDGVPRLATAVLVSLAAYALAMTAGSRLVIREVNAWMAARGDVPQKIMAGPVPANPFARNVVIADDAHYHFLEFSWLRGDRLRIAQPAIDRGPRDEIVRAALTAEGRQGFLNWIRFPVYRVEPTEFGYRVTVRDARYASLSSPAFGEVTIDLDGTLQVLTTRPN